MPYESYRLYQVERAKSRAEIHRADEQAARLASTVPWLLRVISGRVRAACRSRPAAAATAHPSWQNRLSA